MHGNGVHMDDYETHDDRRLIPGTGFTIEPGLYFDTFGLRTEINMTVGAGEATITGDVQRDIVDAGLSTTSADSRRTEDEYVDAKDDVVLRRPDCRGLAGHRDGDRLAPRHGAGVDGPADRRRRR